MVGDFNQLGYFWYGKRLREIAEQTEIAMTGFSFIPPLHQESIRKGFAEQVKILRNILNLVSEMEEYCLEIERSTRFVSPNRRKEIRDEN